MEVAMMGEVVSNYKNSDEEPLDDTTIAKFEGMFLFQVSKIFVAIVRKSKWARWSNFWKTYEKAWSYWWGF